MNGFLVALPLGFGTSPEVPIGKVQFFAPGPEHLTPMTAPEGVGIIVWVWVNTMTLVELLFGGAVTVLKSVVVELDIGMMTFATLSGQSVAVGWQMVMVDEVVL